MIACIARNMDHFSNRTITLLHRADTLQGIHPNKETLILVGHYVFSGLSLLPSVSLLAIPVGDITKTGTSAGQR